MMHIWKSLTPFVFQRFASRAKKVKVKRAPIVAYQNELKDLLDRKVVQKTEAMSKYSKARALFKKRDILKVIKDTYADVLQDENGNIINVRKLSIGDINNKSDKSRTLFKAIHEFEEARKSKPRKKLIWSLLDILPTHSLDSYYCTREVLKLLEIDNGDPTRALWVVKNAPEKNTVVAMNMITKCYFDHGKIEQGWKSFNDRKRWRIAANNESYIILYNGIAKATEWGKFSQTDAQKLTDHFVNFMEKTLEVKSSEEKPPKRAAKCSIAHFNAVLGALAKNFDDDQQLMWSFFDHLLPKKNLPHGKKYELLFADIMTYTTLLQGVKKYYEHKANEVVQKRLSTDKSLVQLLDIQAKLIATSKLILYKVIEGATPPTPPTKEQVAENPGLLDQYKKKARKPLLEIDQHFMVALASCFADFSFRTGTSLQGSVHYKYALEALNFMKIWSNDCENIIKFIENPGHELNLEDITFKNILKPSLEVQKLTDQRVNSALNSIVRVESECHLSCATKKEDILPETIIGESVTEKQVNPDVIFPPPIFSKHKTKALFSAKKKSLVDFKRPTRSYLQEKKDHQIWLKTKGQYGKKMSNSSNESDRKQDINKFSFKLMVDILTCFRDINQFYLMMWYSLYKWAKIDIDLHKLLQDYQSQRGAKNGVMRKEYMSNIARMETEVQSNPLTSSEHAESVIDILTIENFLYKLSETDFGSDVYGSLLASELFAVITNPKVNKGELKIRPKTIENMFSILNVELNKFKDYNLQKSRSGPFLAQTPRKSLNEKQLDVLLTSLIRVMDGLRLHHLNTVKNPQSVRKLLPVHTESFNSFIKKIGDTVWNTENEFNHHIKIIRAGIFYYRAKSVQSVRFSSFMSYTNDGVLQSLKYCVKVLKERDDLNKYEIRLFKTLKSIYQYDSNDHDKFDAFLSSALNAVENYIDSVENPEVAMETNSVPEHDNSVEPITSKETSKDQKSFDEKKTPIPESLNTRE